MKNAPHYVPTEGGFQIRASSEKYNRLLYGSHKNDHKQESFGAFAGDVPVFMGALSDYSEYDWCSFAKCGTQMFSLL